MMGHDRIAEKSNSNIKPVEIQQKNKLQYLWRKLRQPKLVLRRPTFLEFRDVGARGEAEPTTNSTTF